LTGKKHPEQYSADLAEEYDFYDLSGMVTDLFTGIGLDAPMITAGRCPRYEVGVCAEIRFNGNVIGYAGQVHSKLTKGMRIRHPLFMAEINLHPILRKMGKARRYQGMSFFPSTARDVAFVAPESLTHKEITDVVGACKVSILEDVHLFDVFRDETAIGAGKKSMAYSLTFRSPDRTLKDKEVNKAHEYVKRELVGKLGIEIR
jgi:phenylalanyl-tRNA synthetase beta chain